MHIDARHAALAVRIGLDDAGIGCKAFAAHQAFGQATPQDLLEDETQRVIVTEPAVPILRERRMIRYRVFQAKPAKPAVSQVQVHFFA